MRLVVQHRDIPQGYVHGIVNWVFSNLTERDNFTGITAEDIHKVCFVESGTGEYFAVAAVDQINGVVTWHSLGGEGGGGGSNTTDLSIGNRNSNTLQINSSNGTDVVGEFHWVVA